MVSPPRRRLSWLSTIAASMTPRSNSSSTSREVETRISSTSEGSALLMRFKQQRQLVADDVMADADHEPPLLEAERADRAVMGGDQVARRFEEGVAVGRQPHQPRRPLQQPPAERVLQPLDLQADRRLRRVHGLGGARKAFEIRCQNKGLDGLQIQRFHGVHPFQNQIIEIVFDIVSQ